QRVFRRRLRGRRRVFRRRLRGRRRVFRRRLRQPALPRIDNNVRGSGQNQFNYNGTWSHCTGCAGNYLNTVSYSNVTNDTVSLTFSGTRVKIYGNTWGGIGAVSIDGGAETNVDFGTATLLKWTSPALSAGSHTLTIRVTGNLGVGTNRSVVLDYVEVTP
ncbi:hypothetical protein HC891_28440, partial [Candidatus Gracilibacteria bacterium]|nr:hypothetical protein [Candidatus Gracilibacteria bacterium]